MTTLSRRRKLIVIVLAGLAVVGATIRLGAADPSLAHDIGNLLLVLWLPVIGNVIAFLIAHFHRGRPALPAFAAGTPFIRHLLAEFTPLPPGDGAATPSIPHDEACCTLIVGSDGFTARLQQPLAAALAPVPSQTLELQLLRPALALPRLPVAADFRILMRGAIIGQGRVIELR
jgi:hypothetical protein